MASNSSRGNYYKRKTKDYFEKLGYEVQITEFMCATMIRNKCFYRKIDIFGSDGIAMNRNEIIFWNSKSVTGITNTVANVRASGIKEFNKYPFPACVKRQLVIWEPRKKPLIVEI